MRKKLLINLLFTVFISFIATGLVFTIWYNFARMGFEERQATAILFLILTVIQNLAITLFTLPILFQVDTSNFFNHWTKITYLYLPPLVVTLLFSLFYLKYFGDKILFAFIVAPTIFMSASSYFYRKLIRTKQGID